MNNKLIKTDDVFQRLENWYLGECNEDWEHSFGVTIQSSDNPGWIVQIDLIETVWENIQIPLRSDLRTEKDWIHIQVKDGKFTGSGGAQNLTEIINEFLVIVAEKTRGNHEC
ncbi:immunity 53 family protein [Sulfuriferula thiophila]|uniref:immunity 53 family protein n=1 Tax=Sulfuriferula thiophila TaxID=1781211 RepID=UPI000F6126F0|nr:immunity 53 family protein [Sulfuriferula thiophila]